MALCQLELFSWSLKTRTRVNVLVPSPQPSLVNLEPVTSKSTAKTSEFIERMGTDLPVLYLLHGTFGDEGDWERFSRIEDYARNYKLIVVMPQGENSSYRDMPSGQNYATYITKELPAMIEWMFPASKKREKRFICGLSMGGSGAYKLGLGNPDLYGYVASLSGGFQRQKDDVYPSDVTIWSHAYTPGESLKENSEDYQWLANELEKNERPALYLACGEQDFLFEANQELHEYLNSIQYDHVYDTHAGIHNWDFWDDEIQKVLKWLPLQSTKDFRDL